MEATIIDMQSKVSVNRIIVLPTCGMHARMVKKSAEDFQDHEALPIEITETKPAL